MKLNPGNKVVVSSFHRLLRDVGIYSRQDAKNTKLEESLRGDLCAFARDNPRLTGARSASYEILPVLRAFLVNPVCSLLVATQPRLGPCGEEKFEDLTAAARTVWRRQLAGAPRTRSPGPIPRCER
jgi:hypothetical protein